jgi:penicillin G amidase
MRFFKFLFALAGLCGSLWLLTTGLNIKGKTLPPLGSFLNPFSGFWQNAEPKLGLSAENDIKLMGLTGEVSVVMDDLAIPHIFAQNLQDALTVQGYVTARDRLFQMDISARKSLGRLSELVGERTIATDQKTHHKGMPVAVDKAVAATRRSPESSQMLDAYLRGVNAYISQLTPDQYPIEYKLMNAAPELWTAHHALSIIEGMSESLVARNDDVQNSENLQLLGKEGYDMLFPRYNPDQAPIIPDHGQWKGIAPWKPGAAPSTDIKAVDQEQGTGVILPVGQIKKAMPEPAGRYESMSGSNNWAVAGSRTASGKPMLANDPHLNLTLPSIWYNVQIHTPECNVFGVSLPGVPGVIIGFNEHIAWGMTNVSHDVGDYYRIKWANAEKTQYILDGKSRDVQMQIATIKVKGRAEPVLDTVRYTDYGPVQSIVPGEPECDLAYQWLPNFEPSPDLIIEFLKLNQAKDYDAYRSSISQFDVPAQNFVFASRSGDIGITAQGKFPLRTPDVAEFVADGSTSATAWQGYVPNNLVPAEKNSERGFVFSANQHSTPPSYPFPYYGYFDDYRGRYIHQRLYAGQKMTPDSMAAVQLSSHLQMVDDVLPSMLALLDTTSFDPATAAAITSLRTWDGNHQREAIAPILFDLWHNHFYDLVFDDFIARIEKGGPVAIPDNWILYDLVKKSPKHKVFDMASTTEIETAPQLAQHALNLAMKDMAIKALEGKTTWGAYRGMTIKHIARLPGFEREVLTDGHPNAPNANKATHGPSWRMIVDMQDSVRALGVYPGGQSGNPGSIHYDDMLAHWADGKYYDCLLLRSADQKHERITYTQKFVTK